jgi:nucleotide-binding universal stress UspA family protein
MRSREREKEPAMFKRILVATDGAPVSERQVLYAEHLARVEGAEVIVLHAYEPPERYDGYAGYDQLLESYRAVAQAIVDDMVHAFREYGIAASGELRVGAAAEAIVAAAADHTADLIVLGTRGHNSPREILGGVSTQVLRFAHCPVLQVP